MSTLEDIKAGILQLSHKDFSRLRKWVIERDAEIWDQQIEEDAREGKLDFLVEEALREFRS